MRPAMLPAEMMTKAAGAPADGPKKLLHFYNWRLIGFSGPRLQGQISSGNALVDSGEESPIK
jgi:hypothetical protein